MSHEFSPHYRNFMLAAALLLVALAVVNVQVLRVTSPFNVALSTPSFVESASPAESSASLAGLIGSLRAGGAAVTLDEAVQHPFFAVPGAVIEVNGADVQVFEYPNAESLQADVMQITPDGYMIGGEVVDWASTPHFYAQGRLLVVYVGADDGVLSALGMVFGEGLS